MKVCAWQAGSQSDVFPLQIFCKCQLSYYGAKLNMHTHTLTHCRQSINSANYYSHHKYLLSYTLHFVSVRIHTTFQFCMMPSKSKKLLSYPLPNDRNSCSVLQTKRYWLVSCLTFMHIHEMSWVITCDMLQNDLLKVIGYITSGHGLKGSFTIYIVWSYVPRLGDCVQDFDPLRT